MSRRFKLVAGLLILPLSLVCAAALALCADGYQQDSASAPAAPKAPPVSQSAEAKKPKKVWTNEDLSGSGGTGSPSADGKNAATAKSAPGKPADAQFVANLRKQLEKLQGQLADTNKQIAELDSFRKGETGGTSARQLHKGYNMEPVDEQIEKLREKKKQIQAKIEGLLDDARKKGIEPGQLR
jgi:hypothetical protein